MYKKYITRKGRKRGPYYYESVREKSGKIRAFYLGKDPGSQKFKDKIELLKLKGVVKKGNSFIVSVDVERPKRPFKIDPRFLALKYFFGDKISKIKSNFSKLTLNLPKLPRFSFKIKLPELQESKEFLQRKLEEYVPKPGKNDFDFHAALFILLSVIFVFGFFWLHNDYIGFTALDVSNITQEDSGVVSENNESGVLEERNATPLILNVLNYSCTWNGSIFTVCESVEWSGGSYAKGYISGGNSIKDAEAFAVSPFSYCQDVDKEGKKAVNAYIFDESNEIIKSELSNKVECFKDNESVISISNETINESVEQNLSESITNVNESNIIPELNESEETNLSGSEENISETNVTEANKEQNLTEVNISEVNWTNETVEITENGNETIIQYQAVINQPVKWKKTIKLEQPNITEVELPKGAKILSVKKIEDNESIDITDEVVPPQNLLTGFSFLLTGFSIFEEANVTSLLIDQNVSEVEIEYETEAPQVSEEKINGGKRVIVSSDVHYENILTYTSIRDNAQGNIKLYRIVNGSRIEHPIIYYNDTDASGSIDQIYWITPSLSNETFEVAVIEVAKALHLDFNYTFISDVSEEVGALDNNWSESIYADEFLRITFEKPLDATRDITVYVRNKQGGNTKIEVYEFNTTNKIVDFPTITSEGYYKVFLTGMNGIADTFDLKIVGASNNYLEFDYVVDPIPTIASVDINTSNPASNDTSVNITIYPRNVADADGDKVQNITNWYVNATSLAVLNMPFETNISGNGTALRDYSGTQNGTMFSNVTYTSAGIRGGAYFFNRSSTQKIIITKNSVNNLTGAFTINAWVNATTWAGAASFNYIISDERPESPFPSVVLRQDGGNINFFFIWNGAQRVVSTGSSANASTGQWHMITALFNGSETRLYTDGLLRATTGGGSGTVATSYQNWSIGGHPTIAGRSFNGTIDEVLIINRSLSAQQILYLNNSPGDWETIVAEESAVNETWSACVTPNDATSDGNTVCTTQNVTLNDSFIPKLDRVDINSTDPTTNNTGQNITIYPRNVTDANNDIVINVSNWYKDGSSLAVLNMPFETNVSPTVFGSIRDYSINKNATGSAGAPNLLWTNVTSVRGGAYKFDGGGAHINVSPDSDTSFTSSQNWTVTFWMNGSGGLVGQGGGSGQDLISHYNGSTVDYWEIFYVPASGFVSFVVSGNTSSGYAQINSTGSSAVQNKTHFIVAMWEKINSSSGNMSLWVNGKTSASNTTVLNLSARNMEIGIGGRPVNTNGYKGLIDEVLILNRSISQQEILYLNGSSGVWETIVTQEVKAGEVWSACVTPNDAGFDGTTICSANYTVLSICGDISSSTTLTGGASATGTCFNITADNVVLDCAGYTVTYGSAAQGNAVTGDNRTNVTVQNCILTDVEASNGTSIAVNFTRTNNSLFFNNTITTNGTNDNYGIQIARNSSRNSILNNTIKTNGNVSQNFGILLSTSIYDNNITGNNISTNGSATNMGIRLITSCYRNTIQNNTIFTAGTGANDFGIDLSTDCNLNNVTGNRINTSGTNTNTGVKIETRASNNTVTNNNITAGGSTTVNVGVVITTTTVLNNISMNNISTSGTTDNYGVNSLSGGNNTIENNNISATGTGVNVFGIWLQDSDNNATGNTVKVNAGGGATGLRVSGAFRNIFNNNVVFATGTSNALGVNVLTRATDNNITNNVINTSGTGGDIGINIQDSSNNTFVVNNTITTGGSGTTNFGIEVIGSMFGVNISRNRVNTSGTSSNFGIRLRDSTNLSVVDRNNITTGGSSTLNHGIIVITASSSDNITNNVINTIGTGTSRGIWLENLTNTNLFDGNNVTTKSGGDGSEAILINIANNSVFNNTFIYDPVNWTASGKSSVGNNFSNTTFANINGTITYLGLFTINGSTTISLAQLNTTFNRSYLNATNLTFLNTSAVIRLYLSGLGLTNPQPLVDTEDDGTYNICQAAKCTEIGFTSGVFTFNVTNWSSFAASETALIPCGDISSSTTLNTNVTSIGTCFNITADNVVLDCAGYGITYGTVNAGNGVTADNRSNVTVQNCFILDNSSTNSFGIGINFTRTNLSLMYNNTIDTNGTTDNYGIQIKTNSYTNRIENNTIRTVGSGANDFGINIITNTGDNNITGNTISTNGTTTNYGIVVQTDASRTTINLNNITTVGSGASNIGIYLLTRINSTNVTNNIINTSGTTTNYGIQMDTSANNSLVLNNSIFSGGSTTNNIGIRVFTKSFNNNITHNRVLSRGTNDNYGVDLNSNVNLTVVEYNNLTTNGTTTQNIGIILEGTSGMNNLTNNVIFTNGSTTAYGIYILTSSRHNVVDNNNITVTGSSTSIQGILMTTSSINNNLTNNIINTSGTGTDTGILLNSDINDTLVLNNTINTGGTGASNIGIDVITKSYRNNITGNRIQTSGTSSSHGIRFSGDVLLGTAEYNNITTSGTAGSNFGIYVVTRSTLNNITNNVINTSGTTTNYGIQLDTSVNNSFLLNNTVNSGGSTLSNTGIRLTTKSFFNNITHNRMSTSGTSSNYGVDLTTNADYTVIEYNNISTNGTIDNNHGINQATSWQNNITNNLIVTNSSSANSNEGMRLDTDSNNTIIDNNNITTMGIGSQNYGIYLFRRAVGINVTNNIVNTSGTSTNVGINLDTSANNTLVLNNSILSGGSAQNNHGMRIITKAFFNNLTHNRVLARGTNDNYGIHLTTNGDINVVEYNNLTTNGTTTSQIGILVTTATGNNLSYNVISTNGSTTNVGIRIVTDANNTVVDNNNITTTGSGNSNFGFDIITRATGNNITNNIINTSGTSGNYGIQVTTSNTTLILNNTVNHGGSTNDNEGIIILTKSFFNNVTHNRMTGKGGTQDNVGVTLRNNGDINVVEYNNISTNGTTTGNIGIVQTTSTLNNITNNVIQTNGSSTNYGILIQTDANNTVLDKNNISTVRGTTAHGIYLFTRVLGINVTENFINFSNTNSQGIRLDTSINTSLIYNNTITSDAGGGSKSGIRLITNVFENNITFNIINTSGTNDNYGIELDTVSSNNSVAYNRINTSGTSTGQRGISLTLNSDNNTINRNNITTGGSSAANHGIYVNLNSSNNNVTNNIINSTGSGTVYGIAVENITEANSMNRFDSNNISVSSAGSFAIFLRAANDTIFNNTYIRDVPNWTSSARGNNNNSFENTTFANINGTINFRGTFSLNGTRDITLALLNTTFNRSFVNSSNLTFLNTSAVIRLYLSGLGLIDPQPLVDLDDDEIYNVCQAAKCTEIGFTSGVFTFNVSSWTRFAARETPLNSAPTITSVDINTTDPTKNNTAQNVTIYPRNVTDSNGDRVTNISNWYLTGTSLAVLNMPFETNISTNASRNIRDYSSLENNGTLSNTATITWTNTTGVRGGAYRFIGGTVDLINISNTNDFNFTSNSTFSVAVWFNASDGQTATNYNVLVARADDSNINSWYIVYRRALRAVIFGVKGNTSGQSDEISSTSDSTPANKSNFVVAVFRKINTTSFGMELYTNGKLQDNTSSSKNVTAQKMDVFIGGSTATWGLSTFNGTIDEVMIFNRSLSAQEIVYLNNSNGDWETIVSQELAYGDVWSSCVTPNDGTTDGSAVCTTKNVTINTPPTTPVLEIPPNYNVTTNRTPFFNWTASTDADGDAITYVLNITCLGGCTADNRYKAGLTNNNHTLSGELVFFADDNYKYNWTVLATDGKDNGSYAVPFTLNITTYVSIKMNGGNISFGELALGANNDTTDNSPNPFTFENDGNIEVNLSINGTSLWVSTPSPTTNYQFKADNVSGENNSFNWSASTTTYTNMPLADTRFVHLFNHSDNRDSLEVDINITTPTGEPPGDKNSNVTVTAVRS